MISTTKENNSMSKFRFSVGPWNVHSGADSYGPATREEITFEEKVKKFAQMGFSAVQFHDDDAVPNINDYTPAQIIDKAKDIARQFNKIVWEKSLKRL